MLRRPLKFCDGFPVVRVVAVKKKRTKGREENGGRKENEAAIMEKKEGKKISDLSRDWLEKKREEKNGDKYADKEERDGNEAIS